MKKIIALFIILVVLSPLGLIAPGSAWGEWGLDEIRKGVGFIPRGMHRWNGVFSSLLPDYAVPGMDKNFLQSVLGYIISAILGIALIMVVFWILGRFIPERKESRHS